MLYGYIVRCPCNNNFIFKYPDMLNSYIFRCPGNNSFLFSYPKKLNGYVFIYPVSNGYFFRYSDNNTSYNRQMFGSEYLPKQRSLSIETSELNCDVQQQVCYFINEYYKSSQVKVCLLFIVTK